MPASKKESKLLDFRHKAATLLQIEERFVFILPATADRMEGEYRTKMGKLSRSARTKPVLAIWTLHLSSKQIAFCKSKKDEMKKMASDCGAKMYLTQLHPYKNERKEHRRRKSSVYKRALKQE